MLVVAVVYLKPMLIYSAHKRSRNKEAKNKLIEREVVVAVMF